MDIQPLTHGQLVSYFARIELQEDHENLQPDLHLLCKLHLAHVKGIPYENLSLHLDKVRRRQNSCRWALLSVLCHEVVVTFPLYQQLW